MSFTLEEVRRIAQDVATLRNPNLNVLAARTSEGGSDYIEVLIVDRACDAEPCRFVLGADRAASEPDLRATIDEHLRRQLDHRDQS